MFSTQPYIYFTVGFSDKGSLKGQEERRKQERGGGLEEWEMRGTDCMEMEERCSVKGAKSETRKGDNRSVGADWRPVGVEHGREN